MSQKLRPPTLPSALLSLRTQNIRCGFRQQPLFARQCSTAAAAIKALQENRQLLRKGATAAPASAAVALAAVAAAALSFAGRPRLRGAGAARSNSAAGISSTTSASAIIPMSNQTDHLSPNPFLCTFSSPIVRLQYTCGPRMDDICHFLALKRENDSSTTMLIQFYKRVE